MRRVKATAFKYIYPKYKKYKKDYCETCKFRGEPCQMDINHKNGNHLDNQEKNLETLCANCHRLVSYKQRLERGSRGKS